MPFIEQVELGSRWDFSKPWHEHEDKVRNVVPDIFFALASQWYPTRRTRSLRTTVSGGGRLPCGCPVPARTEVKDLDVTGALCDYAGNHGDLTPGATGAPTDFYFGGNGTGVIISVRPECKSGKAIAPRIVFVWLPSRMAHRTHSLWREVCSHHKGLGISIRFPSLRRGSPPSILSTRWTWPASRTWHK